MNIIDAVIVLFLLAGAVLGFKNGVIHSGVTFLGTIIVVILAYALKNPLTTILYTYLPFINFSGVFEGVTVLNILVYEVISFLIIFAILMAILRGILLFTGLIEKILKFTIVLGIPSKLLGAVLGFFEAYLILFIVLFSLSQFSFSAEVMNGSKYSPRILEGTPILSDTVGKAFATVQEIYSIKDNYKESTNKHAYNMEALDILLKHEVISVKSARKLIEKDKLPADAENIINKYEVQND